MRKISLFIAVLFLVSTSACMLKVGSDGKVMIVNEQELTDTGVVKDDATVEKTQIEVCLERCDALCQVFDKCEATTCSDVCAIFESGPAVVCEPKIGEKCGLKDEAEYIKFKNAIAAKCDLIQDATKRDECFKINIETLLKSDCAQQVCTKAEVAGPCTIDLGYVCKDKEVIIPADEALCAQAKAVYDTKYMACKKLGSEAEIMACIKKLEIEKPAVVKICTATTEIQNVCEEVIKPLSKPNITCTQDAASKICGPVNKEKCDLAYNTLFEDITAVCGPKNSTASYNDCYAATKWKLVGDGTACEQKCISYDVVKKYSVTTKEQIFALSSNEALQIFLDALKLPEVCKVIEEPKPAEPTVAKPAEPAPAPEPVALFANIYSNDVYVEAGNMAGFDTAISGLNYDLGFSCKWYVADANADAIFEEIPNYKNCGYSINPATIDLNGKRFFFVVFNGDKSVKSNVVTLYVKAKPAAPTLVALELGIGKEWPMKLGSGTGFNVNALYTDGSSVIIDKKDLKMIIENTLVLEEKIENPSLQINAIGIGITKIHVYYKEFSAEALVTVK